MPQLSRLSTMPDDHDGVAELAAQVEVAARALLTLSTRAGLQLPGTVSLTQLRALSAVEDAGSCTLGSLAEVLQISLSAASRLVDRITSAGLLDRRQSETSRRELTLRVTARGRRLLRRHEAARRAVFSGVLQELSAGDTQALLRGLRAVQDHLSTSSSRTM
jgi:DNA-binding MarR family transcriptional regulator